MHLLSQAVLKVTSGPLLIVLLTNFLPSTGHCTLSANSIVPAAITELIDDSLEYTG